MIYPIVTFTGEGPFTVPAQAAIVERATGTILQGWCYPGRLTIDLPAPIGPEYDCIDMSSETVDDVQVILGSQHLLTLTLTAGGWEREEE